MTGGICCVKNNQMCIFCHFGKLAVSSSLNANAKWAPQALLLSQSHCRVDTNTICDGWEVTPVNIYHG